MEIEHDPKNKQDLMACDDRLVTLDCTHFYSTVKL